MHHNPKPAIKTATSYETSPRDTFLTEHDLALRQNRSVKTIRNDRVKGEGAPFVKFGRLVRYRLSDVAAWEQGKLRRSTSDIGGEHV